MTPDPLTGTNYRVQRTPNGEPVVLGAGGVGIVFEAVDRASGERVAVKVLRPEFATDDSVRERVRREAALLEALEHRYIVKFLDAGETASGLPFMAMELLEGRTVAQRLQAEGPFRLGEAVALILQVLEGLWFMHSKGVIHRDLKLDNIFLKDDCEVRILDVGLAKELRDRDANGMAEKSLTSKGTIIGTPRYMSPEQASGLRADQRSDVYTAGYIFYTMISGRLPYEQFHDSKDLLLAHAIHPPELPSRHFPGLLSEGLEAVVLKALEKDPADRFDTAQQFARALHKEYRTANARAAADAAAVEHSRSGEGPASATALERAAGGDIRRSERSSNTARKHRGAFKALIFLTISLTLTVGITRFVAWVFVRSSP